MRRNSKVLIMANIDFVRRASTPSQIVLVAFILACCRWLVTRKPCYILDIDVPDLWPRYLYRLPPLRRRATPAEDVSACPEGTSKAMLLAHNICRGGLIPCSQAISSIGQGHSARVYIYTGNNDASPSHVLSGGRHTSSYEGAETQAVLLPLYISTASSPSYQPTRRLLQRYELVLASFFSSLAAKKEEEEARRGENRTRHASRERLSDPVQHLLGSVYLILG